MSELIFKEGEWGKKDKVGKSFVQGLNTMHGHEFNAPFTSFYCARNLFNFTLTSTIQDQGCT